MYDHMKNSGKGTCQQLRKFMEQFQGITPPCIGKVIVETFIHLFLGKIFICCSFLIKKKKKKDSERVFSAITEVNFSHLSILSPYRVGLGRASSKIPIATVAQQS